MLKTGNFLLTLLLFVLCRLQISYSANLYCYKGSLTSITMFDLDDPEPLLSSTCYNAEKKTVVYAFGYGTTPSDADVQAIVGAFLRTGEVNIMLLNWEKEAVSNGSLTYRTAVRNVNKVGKKFGDSLMKLNTCGLPFTQVHLVGHSLGAQLMAVTGRVVKGYGKTISRITGLDPAGPLFMSPLSINKKDASFVDVIHTNPGSLGNARADATMDVWANCGDPEQPGCMESSLESDEIELCSHQRSWMYYAESIENPTAFEARSARSCMKWKSVNGNNKTIYWGENIDTTARGKFYLKTNGSSPYGLGGAGTKP